MGRVRKRRSSRHGTRYLAIARLDGTDSTVGTFETFEDATDAWQRAEVEGRRRTGGATLAAGRISFAQLVELYFASAGLEATTRKAYRSHCSSHLLPRFATLLLRDLDAAAVGAWMNDQAKAGVSLRTRVATRATLSSILQFAADNGRIPFNPVAATRAPKRSPLNRRRPVLRPDQWPTLRREFNGYGPETQLLVDLAIDSGLRFGELTDLRPVHLVDRGSKPYIKVQTVVVWPGEADSSNGDVVERKYYTKGVEDRRVDLSVAVYDRLRAHLDRLALSPEDLIFSADRIRAEHHAWRDAQEALARDDFEAQWQARLAAAPLIAERYQIIRADGKVRSGAHGRPNTYSLGLPVPALHLRQHQLQPDPAGRPARGRARRRRPPSSWASAAWASRDPRALAVRPMVG